MPLQILSNTSQATWSYLTHMQVDIISNASGIFLNFSPSRSAHIINNKMYRCTNIMYYTVLKTLSKYQTVQKFNFWQPIFQQYHHLNSSHSHQMTQVKMVSPYQNLSYQTNSPLTLLHKRTHNLHKANAKTETFNSHHDHRRP